MKDENIDDYDDKFLDLRLFAILFVTALFMIFVAVFLNLVFSSFHIKKAASKLARGDYIFKPADEKRYCAKCKNEIKYSKFEHPYFTEFEREYYFVECEHCKTKTIVYARSPLEAVDTVGIKNRDTIGGSEK